MAIASQKVVLRGISFSALLFFLSPQILIPSNFAAEIIQTESTTPTGPFLNYLGGRKWKHCSY
jgi:hypothetical protein